MADLPPPIWNNDARDGYQQSQLSGLRAYEDRVVKRILTSLGLGPLARVLAREVGAVTGLEACSFAAMDERLNFPVKFGVGKIKAVKFLSIPDLFDRWTRLAIHQNLVELSQHHEPGTPLALVFKFTGDSKHPGPKGGQFMCLHTFDSTAVLNNTKLLRAGHLGGIPVVFTMEVLDSLLANFAGFEIHDS